MGLQCSTEECNQCKQRVCGEGPTVIQEGQKNAALLFIKPHAMTEQVRTFVLAVLADKKIRILKEGDISATNIDKNQLIDYHDYVSASMAVLLKPADHSSGVDQDKFKEKFAISWADAVSGGSVLNAVDAMAKLNVEPADFKVLWDKSRADKRFVHFGDGTTCGAICREGEETLFVFNGDWIERRLEFTTPGVQIHYYSVEWDPDQLKWADFRNDIIGETNPEMANPTTMRHELWDKHDDFGLAVRPGLAHNCVHASASPFEGLAERCNWIKADLEKDPYGKQLMSAGITPEWIQEGFKNPNLVLDNAGGFGRLFEQVLNMDTLECTTKLMELHDLGLAVMNAAIIYIKPHAHTRAYEEQVSKSLREAGIRVTGVGYIEAGRVDDESDPGKKVPYFKIEWDPSCLTWSSFLEEVIGPANPASASAGSLRGTLYNDFRSYGLETKPTTEKNCVHASASPFEAMLERRRWFATQLEDDPFGKLVVSSSIDEVWFEDLVTGAFLRDPQVKLDATGRTGSLFGALRGADAKECLARLRELWLASQGIGTA